MIEFGKQYGHDVISNAMALAQALHERGLTVLGEENGFTQSHQVAVDVTKYGLGGDMENALEKANVIVNRQLLPGDIQAGRHYTNPGGIRIGTSEITRIGMKKSEMIEVAEFIKRIVIEKENLDKVKQDVIDFRKGFQKVHYCFPTATSAYEYIRIR
jgi:glycine hydroxymethyltransferase